MQDSITHRHLTLAIVGLASKDLGYGEVSEFADLIAQASVDEDESPRFLQHFYDPDTGRGLPVESLFLLYEEAASGPAGKAGFAWPHVDTSAAVLADASSYVHALDWARERAPAGMNWLGAL